MTTNSKKTKIIATLGPASDNPDVLKRLILTGANLIRINASHLSTASDMAPKVKLIRKVAKKLDRSVGIILDLQGPKIRIGDVKQNVSLKEGSFIDIVSHKVLGSDKEISVSYEGFVNDVNLEEDVFIDDGRVRLKVVEKQAAKVRCLIVQGGPISGQKGVNLPNSQLEISALTDKDLLDVKQGVECKVDYIALSFVSCANDMTRLRNLLIDLDKKNNIQLIAKLERQQAIDHLDAIIESADAVMVARGDLGVEIGFEQVPKYQKMIIRAANKHIKPVIVATQMLESTIHDYTATRAEVSDVANAIYDHCDAVMLSAETAVGIDPVNAVDTMSRICFATDQHLEQLRSDRSIVFKNVFHTKTRATSMCKAADQIAEENQAKAIMAFTSSGNTPLITSKLDSKFMIIAPTDDIHICNRLSLYRGVIPLLLDRKFDDIVRWTDMIRIAVRQSVEKGFCLKGDVLVVLAGIPIGKSNGINSIRIITV